LRGAAGNADVSQMMLRHLRSIRLIREGFGLPITRELAELYGGTFALGRSAIGGLRAVDPACGEMNPTVDVAAARA
jgi:hypothetical protein